MLLTVVAFLLVLGVLVFVHELGHYLAARAVGVRVEQFSIGFPPRMIGRRWGETEYLISWIPIGGYVRLYGQNLEDENPRDPRNYAAKPVWQRLFILVAGPAMNLLLALLVMPAVYLIGVEQPGYRTEPPRIAAVAEGSAAARAGLAAGDRVLSVGGTATATWNELYRAVEDAAVRGGPVRLVVRRDGGRAELSVPVKAFTSTEAFGWSPRIAPVAGRVGPDTPAARAGLAPGDRIVAVDGEPIESWRDISAAIQAAQPEVAPDGGGAPEGRPLALTVERQGQRRQIRITPAYHPQMESWLIGISPVTRTERYGPVDAFAKGTGRLAQITGSVFVFLGHLISGQGSMDQLGGPVKIGAFIGEAARSGLPSLIFLVAFISLQLGIFNLLPIPALDGGHIFFFLLPEVAHLRFRWAEIPPRARRAPAGRWRLRVPVPDRIVFWTPLSSQVRQSVQTVGMALLLLFMVIVTYNDIVGLLS